MRRALLGAGPVLCVLAALACGVSPEEQTLLRFFEAAPTLDSTVIRKYATIGFAPQTDGVVQTFTVTSIGSETGTAKDVTIDAAVLEPGGTTARRTMIVKFEKIDGRWLITGLRQAPASRTSRAASSAQPN